MSQPLSGSFRPSCCRCHQAFAPPSRGFEMTSSFWAFLLPVPVNMLTRTLHQLPLGQLPWAHSALHDRTTLTPTAPALLSTPTAQAPHKLAMKPSPPPPSLPKSQSPESQAPWGSAEVEGNHLLGAQPTRRQSGGAMGRAEGEGRQKGRTSFFVCFFFFTSFTGRGVCGRGFPPGPLSGDHACSGAFSPSSVGPLSLLPPRGLQPSPELGGGAAR